MKLRGKGAVRAWLVWTKQTVSVTMMVAAAVTILEPQTRKAEKAVGQAERQNWDFL